MTDYLAIARQIRARQTEHSTTASSSAAGSQAAKIAKEAKEALSSHNSLLSHSRISVQLGVGQAVDWLELFQERAAIRQYDGRWPRPLAEPLAYAEVVEAFCWQNPPLLVSGACAGCQRPLAGETLELPDRTRVHFNDDRFECLIAYGSSRTARAIAALAELGLLPPEGYGR